MESDTVARTSKGSAAVAAHRWMRNWKTRKILFDMYGIGSTDSAPPDELAYLLSCSIRTETDPAKIAQLAKDILAAYNWTPWTPHDRRNATRAAKFGRLGTKNKKHTTEPKVSEQPFDIYEEVRRHEHEGDSEREEGSQGG